MRILIATDAWHPQVNGVVTTYDNLAHYAEEAGFTLSFITPESFRTIPLPTYAEIRLALATPFAIAKAVAEKAPDYIHIATEGPIGLATRRFCRLNGRPFVTSYHTRFPEYVATRLPVPMNWGYRFERWFHNAGLGVMAATPALCEELASNGLKNPMLWPRGVDTALFRPRDVDRLGLPRPIFLYVGRIAVEKNIEAFLKLSLRGSKAVVGSGPQMETLSRRFPEVLFTGPKFGEELGEYYASADVFVFPSMTDTFGNVLLEALASGLPVAAFPAPGARDIIRHGEVGFISESLEQAALGALALDRSACRAYAETFSWLASAQQFAGNIENAHIAAGFARRGANLSGSQPALKVI